jgi:hypothetical protein
VANPYAVILVDPSRVTMKLEGATHHLGPPGTILPGQWDRRTSEFTRSWKFRGVFERFELGLPWEETTLFRSEFVRRLRKSGHVMGMRSLSDLAGYYRANVDPLYHKIKSEGLRPPSLRRRIDAIYANIGHDGQVLWGPGGNHRLAIAKILDLEVIPVRIHFRHEDWQKIRERVAETGVARDGEHWQKHPDLADVTRNRDRLSAEGPCPT